MTIAQFIVAYAVSWWLVLFMVLPFGAEAPAQPQKGHAPSAPANPRLKKKCLWASVLAILPTLLIYFVATGARAGETVYHAGSDCHKTSKHVPAADVAARDGYGTGDKRVKAADINPSRQVVDADSIAIPLDIPSQRYLDRAAQADGDADDTPTSINGRNVDLSHSFIEAGKLEVKRDGDVLLNGQSITENEITTDGCGDE
ncbi:MAG: DUF1467 family protein [Alphaproteobacteria bacterium]|nr:DUF1467 family protein [Alphaproteobacteria bacterium]